MGCLVPHSNYEKSRPMYMDDIKDQFLEIRAKGLSLSPIASYRNLSATGCRLSPTGYSRQIRAVRPSGATALPPLRPMPHPSAFSL